MIKKFSSPKIKIWLAQNEKNKGYFSVVVPPAGIEPTSRTPQARILSVELRGQS